MLRSSKELWLALLARVLIGGVQAAVVAFTRQIPAARGWFGQGLGVLGFGLMLATEILYSLRMRSSTARWGRMSVWLQFHIFTGIVGPFMVLLHTSWKFNGLAGASLALTGLIVVSGFIGRYIFTRIQRTANGLEDPGLIGQMQVSALVNSRRLLSLWHTIHIPIGIALFTIAFVHLLGALYYATLLK